MKKKTILEEMKREFPLNSLIKCKVFQLAPWGILVYTDHHLYNGHIRVTSITDDFPEKYIEKYPAMYSEILAKVIGYTPDNNQILLSIKPSDLSQTITSENEKN